MVFSTTEANRSIFNLAQTALVCSSKVLLHVTTSTYIYMYINLQYVRVCINIYMYVRMYVVYICNSKQCKHTASLKFTITHTHWSGEPSSIHPQQASPMLVPFNIRMYVRTCTCRGSGALHTCFYMADGRSLLTTQHIRTLTQGVENFCSGQMPWK